MAKIALFVKATTKPGKRDEVRQLWEEHLKPHAEGNDAHEICFYCYGIEDENTICLFEVFSDPSELETGLHSDWFAAYREAVGPLLAGPPELVTAIPLWAKGASV